MRGSCHLPHFSALELVLGCPTSAYQVFSWGSLNNSRRKCATFKRHVTTSILADVAKDFMTFRAPMFTKPEADPKTVASIILGGGAGTRLFPLTGRRAKPALMMCCSSLH
ncbi:hypothetical protein QYF36_006557 [Acer negundo]|nr:hypothetical protein QYF36_006557 [Acer negundo]